MITKFKILLESRSIKKYIVEYVGFIDNKIGCRYIIFRTERDDDSIKLYKICTYDTNINEVDINPNKTLFFTEDEEDVKNFIVFQSNKLEDCYDYIKRDVEAKKYNV